MVLAIRSGNVLEDGRRNHGSKRGGVSTRSVDNRCRLPQAVSRRTGGRVHGREAGGDDPRTGGRAQYRAQRDRRLRPAPRPSHRPCLDRRCSPAAGVRAGARKETSGNVRLSPPGWPTLVAATSPSAPGPGWPIDWSGRPAAARLRQSPGRSTGRLRLGPHP